jgi:hypothetical protein
MGKTTMDVERDSLGELKKLKADLELKTTSDVVRMLLNHYHGRVDAPESEDEDSGEPAKRRKIDVREALYSLEILSERPGMLEYYTGFDRPAVDLLIRRFSEVGLSRVFSLFCCSARKRAVVVLPARYSDLLDIVHRGRRSS